MKNFLKKSLVIIAMLFSVLSIANLALTTPTYAESTTEGERTFGSCDGPLGLTPWDCNLVEKPENEEDLKNNIQKIILNISANITTVAAYLVLGYIIYGGYLYMFASGDTGKVAAGKKTLTHAFIGLAIVGLTTVILKSIQAAFGIQSFEECSQDITNLGCGISPDQLVSNIFQWVIGIAGAVSLVFIVLGGIKYMTSSGDSGKTQQAKNTIMHSLIGLIIVGLAEAIKTFVNELVDRSATQSGIGEAILALVNDVILIGGIVAVVFVIFGGVQYMTSSGDAGKVKKAKETILNAVIGLVICALAYTIVNFAIATIYKNQEDEEPSGDETSLLEKPIAFLEKKL